MSRRGFLRVTSGVVGWIAARRSIGLETEPALVQEKPPLSGQTINRYIAAAEREDEATRLLLAAEVKRDLLPFLDQRFALSTAQRRSVAMLTEAERQQIRFAVERALRPGWRLIVRPKTSRRGSRSLIAQPGDSMITTTIADAIRTPDGVHGGTVVLWWPCPKQ